MISQVEKQLLGLGNFLLSQEMAFRWRNNLLSEQLTYGQKDDLSGSETTS